MTTARESGAPSLLSPLLKGDARNHVGDFLVAQSTEALTREAFEEIARFFDRHMQR
jgi:hypothetical protein